MDAGGFHEHPFCDAGSNVPSFRVRGHMTKKALRDKIENLIARTPAIANVDFKERTEQWKAEGEAWVIEAVNAVELAVPDSLNAYRNGLAQAKFSIIPLPERVPRIATLLRSLLTDIDAGLISTLANAIRAETLDDFLDQAFGYLDLGQNDQAGVIAAGVFENTMQQIYAAQIDGFSRPQLERVIVALTKNGTITDQQAAQVRVAQHVRNKASHADWSGFDMEGVKDTLNITKTLIEAHLK